MANEMQAKRPERGDQKRAEELIQSYGPVRLILAPGLIFGIAFLGSSTILHNYVVTSGELRLTLVLLLFPVEWGGALLILALLDDFRRAVEERKIPSAS
jgi:hypothetical protein